MDVDALLAEIREIAKLTDAERTVYAGNGLAYLFRRLDYALSHGWERPIDWAHEGIEPGTPVTYITDHLGTTERPDGSRFTDHTVMAGESGVYVKRHKLELHWHVTSVEHEGRTLFVPVSVTMFELTRQDPR